jgi:hypothetical protein
MGFYGRFYYINLLKINILCIGSHWFFSYEWDKKKYFFQFIIKTKNQPMKTLIIISFILAGSVLLYIIYDELKNY